MLMTQIYLRTRQLLRSVSAQPLHDHEWHYINHILLPGQQDLFGRLPVYEQRHALNVCRTLVRGGFGTDRELLQAALLHDLGKFDPISGRTIPVWVKVANVLLGRKRVARLGRSDAPTHWRYFFWLQSQHEKRSAKLVQSVGSSKRVIALVGSCRNLRRRGDQAALALSWADDLN